MWPEELLIISLLLETLGLYLNEICQKVFDVSSAPTVCGIIHRHGFTRNKLPCRDIYSIEVNLFKKEQFVWIDETGYDER